MWALEIKKNIINCKNKGISIKLGWVPSHTNIWGNEKADILANKGRSKQEVEVVRTQQMGHLQGLRKTIIGRVGGELSRHRRAERKNILSIHTQSLI